MIWDDQKPKGWHPSWCLQNLKVPHHCILKQLSPPPNNLTIIPPPTPSSVVKLCIIDKRVILLVNYILKPSYSFNILVSNHSKKEVLNLHIVNNTVLIGWVIVYELSGCRFESSSSHLHFRFRACFEQWVPWHSGHYRVWIHSETRTWHDKIIQLNIKTSKYWDPPMHSKWQGNN